MAMHVKSSMDFKEVLGMSLFPFFTFLLTVSFMQPFNSTFPPFISVMDGVRDNKKLYILTVGATRLDYVG